MDAAGRQLVSMIAGNVLFGTGLIVHAFLYNYYLEALAQPVEVMGHAAAALTGGGVVMLLPAGALADRAGPRVALACAAVVLTVGLVLGAVVAAPIAVYGAAILAGAGSGIWRVAVGPILMHLTEPRTRPRAFAWNVGLLVGWSGLGAALAGASADGLTGRWGLDRLAALRVTLVLGAAVSAASLLVFRGLRLPGARAPEAPVAPAAPTADTLPARAPIVPAPTPPSPIRDALPRVGLVALWMLAPALVAPFFNLYFSREHGLSIERVGFVFAAANAGWALAVLASGEIAGRIGAHRLMASAPLFFAPVMLGLALAASPSLAVGLFVLQGTISPMLNPLIDQWLLGLTPRAQRGAVSGWRQVAADLSAMAGASLGGVLLAAGAFDALFLWAAAIGLVGALGLLAATRATRQLVAVDP